MHDFNARYYAFISRFVDAVTTSPLSQELSRLKQQRRDAAAMLRARDATDVVPLRHAA